MTIDKCLVSKVGRELPSPTPNFYGGNMKTVVIYDQCGEDVIQYFVVNADISHLDRTYVNQSEESKCNELNKILFNDNCDIAVTLLKAFPVQEVIDGAKVIVVGFVP